MDRKDWIALAHADPAGTGPVPSARRADRPVAPHDHRLPGPPAETPADIPADTPADEELSAVVRAAALVTGLPHATVNLLDGDRQCQLATVGFEGTDSPRADSMCAQHVEDGVLVHVPDAAGDPRFAATPWVDGRLGRVRAYASAPLIDPRGRALGSLCVFDTVPREVPADRLEVLAGLAGVLVALFERRRQAREAAERGRRAAEARELAVLAVAEAEARWEQSEVVAETVDVGLVTVDGGGHVTSLNRSARQWHGAGAVHLAADGTTPLPPHELPWLRALREGSVQAAEVVLAVPGRPPRTLVCSGRATHRADGSTLGAVVTLHDVTRARERENALARAHAALAEHTGRVQTLADASRALAAAPDPEQAVCHLVRELTGADAAHLLRPEQGPAGTADTADTADTAGTALHAVATSGLPAAQVTHRLSEPSPAGLAFTSAAPVLVTDATTDPRTRRHPASPTGTAAGAWHPVVLPGTAGQRTVGVLGVLWHEAQAELPDHVLPVLQTLAGEVAHAAERADLLARLAQAAERDALTGLANRRRWDDVLAAEVARAARTGDPLSVAVVDLDHFKRYNDTHGHLGGDELLRGFATAAQACLREVDTLARWGGEEFVAVLPGCTGSAAVAVADRIRAAVPHGQTCTVGIAQWHPGSAAEDVVRRADAALYAGKEQGRDRTVVHP
ncbi:diguanylate cyclase [Kineococcus sp. LSe6-4]|uniref:Diguanylate cyclase n=1 Tax=Kineococcus halophytocola TaxID=3234027 RepID=A0ABV4H3E8_9ACTN